MIAHRTSIFLNDLHILVQLKSTLQLGPFFRETSSPVLKDSHKMCSGSAGKLWLDVSLLV